MKLLIITQKVDKDDENLGSFYRWIEEFAKHCEKVTVIGNSEGNHELPSNVTVCSLGKEKGLGRIRRVWKFWEFFSKEYPVSDAVFFHMIPEAVLASFPFLLSLRKVSALWYAHKSVTFKLKIAERLVDYIFTSSPEGFRLPSKKVVCTGQAINTEEFRPRPANESKKLNTLRLISIGRISPVKNYEILIRACVFLKKEWSGQFVVSIIGGPILERDKKYFETLKKLVMDLNLSSSVHFYGPRPHSEVAEILAENDVFINLSSTGSLDRAVIEAMASGLSVITSNEAYRGILPARYFLENENPKFLAEQIKIIGSENRPREDLREIVVKDHNLKRTVEIMMERLSSKELL